ncbi:MAG: uracil-DNA glycosylase [Alphaproteobacteria bacterium]|nr:uracil-DNA glycosylase [Alphaproteobacteria bacterium]
MGLNQKHLALYELLVWQKEAGADDALDPEPINRLSIQSLQGLSSTLKTIPEKFKISKKSKKNIYPNALPSFGNRGLHHCIEKSLSPSSEIKNLTAPKYFHEQVSRAKNMDELRILVEQFDSCSLKKTAKNVCFADGNATARLMLIGEAPGREEDISGTPFVGPAGQLLNKIIQSIGLAREDIFITNIVFWRPPGNRTPTPAEAELCEPVTKRQIELVNPEILMFLGGTAAKHMLNKTEGIIKLRGEWHSYDNSGSSIPAMATLHPAYLLRHPNQKYLAWRDFFEVKKALLKKRNSRDYRSTSTQ